MKFTINRLAFINALNNVLRAVSSKTTIPILTGLKLVVENDQIILTGSNADISIETTINQTDGEYALVVSEPGAIVLPARFFIEIIKKLPDQEVSIAINDGFQAVITSGTAEFTVNGQDANNFPHLPEVDGTSQVMIAPDILREVIEQTRIAVSKHEGQQYDVVIPGNSLTELSRMVNEVDGDVTMNFTDNQILFTFGQTKFYSRLLEGNYPETSRLIPTSSETTIELAADSFLASIERASLLSHQSRNNVVKLTINPSLSVAKISGNSADVGNVEEAINAELMAGNDLEISFNPDYMRDALKSFGSAKILMSFTSALRPFTLVPADDHDNFVQLITPVRTY